MQITLPSGLSGAIRKLKVAEANMLANRRDAKSGFTFDKLLAAVWTETNDPGPYQFEGLPAWSEVLSGDRLSAILQVRAHSLGDAFDFDVNCPSCGERVKWSVNLSELEMQPLDPEDATQFTSGNEFATYLDDTKVVYRLMTGAGERRAQKMRQSNGTQPITAGILARVVSVHEGEDEVKNIKAWANNLDFGQSLELLTQMDTHDCGIETSFDIVCGECSAVSEVELPFGQLWSRPRSKRARAGV